jgi:hypothetical protein
VSSISRQSPRVLFLDDDPDRAVVFLAECPDALWIAIPKNPVFCVARPAGRNQTGKAAQLRKMRG